MKTFEEIYTTEMLDQMYELAKAQTITLQKDVVSSGRYSLPRLLFDASIKAHYMWLVLAEKVKENVET